MNKKIGIWIIVIILLVGLVFANINLKGGDVVIDKNLTISGDMNLSGRQQGNHLAEMFINFTTTLPTVTQNVFDNITTNVTMDIERGITVSGGKATIAKTAIYHVIHTHSYEGGNSDNYEWGVAVNNRRQSKCEGDRLLSAGGDIGSSTGQCFLLLNAGDLVNGIYRNIDDTVPAVINHYALIISEEG